MPQNTFTLIEKITVGAAGASSITFTSIPQTYTDLKVVASARNTGNGSGQYLTFNGSSTSYSAKRLIANNGSTVTSHNGGTTNIFLLAVDTRATANSFGSAEFYIPNYTSSNNKSVSLDSVNEENGNSYAYDEISAGLWSNSAAITSITLTPEAGNFAQYTTAHLYGIKAEL